MTRPNFDLLSALFLEMMVAEQGAALNTIDAYRHDLNEYGEFLATQGVQVVDAQQSDVRAYLASLGQQGKKPATMARKLSSARQFHRFLYAEHYRADDPAGTIEAPKRGRNLPKILTIKEVDALLRAGHELANTVDEAPEKRFLASRTVCLLEILYASGLRVSELVSLPASLARMDEPLFPVRGKGGRDRLAPMSGSARRALLTALA
jgi:integrase/recombinase XerD